MEATGVATGTYILYNGYLYYFIIIGERKGDYHFRGGGTVF